MRTKAYLREPNRLGECPVSVWYTHDQEWFAVTTGQCVHPDHWDKMTGSVKRTHPDHVLLNAIIDKLKNRLLFIARKMYLDGIDPTTTEVKATYLQGEMTAKSSTVEQAIQALSTPTAKDLDLIPILKEYTLGSKHLSPNTLKQYKLLYNNVTLFAKETGAKITAEGMNKEFYEAWGNWLLYTKDYYNNSFGKMVKMLKSFLNWVDEEKGIRINQAFKKWKVLHEEKEIVYLTPDELDQLYSHEFEEWKKKYADFFVLACETGFRVSDLKRSKLWLIENGMIYLSTKKTNGSAKVPINPRIIEILERYNYDFSNIHEQKANLYIKECIKEIGMDSTYPISKYKWREEYVTYKKKCDLVTMHCGRRSFVTNAFAKGMTETEIMEMIGSTDFKTLQRYIKIECDNLRDKMNSTPNKTSKVAA